MHTLILFDIDGTLIDAAGAGLRGMTAAFHQIHGLPQALAEVKFSGRTDRWILTQGLERAGLEASPDAIAALRDVYLPELERELRGRTREPIGVLPGVLPLLEAMAGDPSTCVALLTGNFAGGAARKLGHFGLWEWFRFGAFGDEHLDRRELVPVALAKADACGLDPQRVIVIGDTPLDVDCAHVHGAEALAVATGIYSRAELEATGAELVVDTLEDPAVDSFWRRAAPASR